MGVLCRRTCRISRCARMRKKSSWRPARQSTTTTRGRRAEREGERSKQPRATKGPCLVFDFSASLLRRRRRQRPTNVLPHCLLFKFPSLRSLFFHPSSRPPIILLLRRGQLASPPLAQLRALYLLGSPTLPPLSSRETAEPSHSPTGTPQHATPRPPAALQP